MSRSPRGAAARWTLTLSGVLAMVAVALTWNADSEPILTLDLPAPVLAIMLAALFLLAEQFLMNVEFRRQAHSLTLAGVPMVLGVLLVSPQTFVIALIVILGWAVTGPIFRWSDTWQLIVNTTTTIVTFLMVFLIQNTQNRDGAAIQTKLDELIRASAAQNTYIGIEHLTEEELDELRQKCEDRAAKAGKAGRAADRAQKKANKKAAEAADRATE